MTHIHVNIRHGEERTDRSAAVEGHNYRLNLKQPRALNARAHDPWSHASADELFSQMLLGLKPGDCVCVCVCSE